jgi:hypothetical protein
LAATKRKKTKPLAGQVVALPLAEGTFGLGHVAAVGGSVTVALFPRRARSPEDLAASLDSALSEPPISTMVVTADELEDGEWPVIGARDPAYPPALLDKRGTSHTATVARFFLSAYHGLVAWDGLYDPKGYEKLLLPGVKVPPTVRYKKDIEAGVPPPPPPKPAPITAGPAEIHVQILYSGEGLPDTDLLRRRQALEQKLDASGAGEVTDAGAGGGVMDVYFATEDVRRALPIVHAALAEHGFSDDALVEAEPLDED